MTIRQEHRNHWHQWQPIFNANGIGVSGYRCTRCGKVKPV